MVQALRHHVPPGQLRFGVPDGGMYLWCQLAAGVRARAVQERALRESVMVLTGEPFYVDHGGDHQLRICFTSQPAGNAVLAAQTLARAIAAAARDGEEAPPLVRVV
jgi:DNA-binding transcriptional MocR family regulator